MRTLVLPEAPRAARDPATGRKYSQPHLRPQTRTRTQNGRERRGTRTDVETRRRWGEGRASRHTDVHDTGYRGRAGPAAPQVAADRPSESLRDGLGTSAGAATGSRGIAATGATGTVERDPRVPAGSLDSFLKNETYTYPVAGQFRSRTRTLRNGHPSSQTGNRSRRLVAAAI